VVFIEKGLIFNIQRFSIHDGPGIRTLVFMKGCPLRCKWCSNPEGIKNYPELIFNEKKCVKCRRCVEVCPTRASTISERGEISIDRRVCIACGKCVGVCFSGAREIVGKYMTVEEIFKEVEKDRIFYENSGGGVTLGGGEPTMQPEFARELLKMCKERSLHTAIETCGYTSWANLKEILKYVDFMYYDIKHIDPAKHKEFTGVSNKLILENLMKVFSIFRLPIVIRVPIIPGYTDSEENIRGIADFVARYGGKMIELLPYHQLGVSKYEQYSMKYELENVKPPSEESLRKLRNIRTIKTRTITFINHLQK